MVIKQNVQNIYNSDKTWDDAKMMTETTTAILMFSFLSYTTILSETGDYAQARISPDLAHAQFETRQRSNVLLVVHDKGYIPELYYNDISSRLPPSKPKTTNNAPAPPVTILLTKC